MKNFKWKEVNWIGVISGATVWVLLMFTFLSQNTHAEISINAGKISYEKNILEKERPATPSDVARAVDEGRLEDADKMISSIVVAKPNSAKAHYIAAQVYEREGKLQQASDELNKASTLDPKISFTDPTRFNNFVAKLSGEVDRANTPKVEEKQPVAGAPVAQDSGHSFGFWVWAIFITIIAVCVFIWFIDILYNAIRRKRKASEVDVETVLKPTTKKTHTEHKKNVSVSREIVTHPISVTETRWDPPRRYDDVVIVDSHYPNVVIDPVPVVIGAGLGVAAGAIIADQMIDAGVVAEPIIMDMDTTSITDTIQTQSYDPIDTGYSRSSYDPIETGIQSSSSSSSIDTGGGYVDSTPTDSW